MVTSYSLADLGYVMLGPVNANDTQRINDLKSIIENIKSHDIQCNGDEVWIKDNARGPNFPYPNIQINNEVAHFTSENIDKDTNYTFIDRYKNSIYSNYQASLSIEWSDAVESSQNAFVSNSNFSENLYQLSLSLMSIDKELLKSFLKNHVFPGFIGAYPEGEILVYMSNEEYDSRFSLMRAGYAYTLFGKQNLVDPSTNEFVGFGTLKNWHMFNTVQQPIKILNLTSSIFYPYINFVRMGPIGLHIIFIPDTLFEDSRPPFPYCWGEQLAGEIGFATQERQHVQIITGNDSHQQNQLTFQRFVLDTDGYSGFPVAETREFIRLIIRKYNRIIFHYSDPCEFVDEDNIVSFINAFEQFMTFDRLLAMSMSCISASEPMTRKINTFTSADLLEELYRQHVQGSNSADRFKELFNPCTGRRIMHNCISEVHTFYSELLSQTINNVYDELKLSIQQNIWITGKVQAGGVMVLDRNLTNERLENWDEFTGNLMRVLRNTHHGYFSSTQSSRNRPARYLSLIKGDIPDSLSMLAPLWFIGLLLNPAEMIGWNFLPTNPVP